MHHFLRLICDFWNLVASAQCCKVICKPCRWGRETAVLNHTLVLMWVVQCQFRKLVASKSSTWLNIPVRGILSHGRHPTTRKVSANWSNPVKGKTPNVIENTNTFGSWIGSVYRMIKKSEYSVELCYARDDATMRCIFERHKSSLYFPWSPPTLYIPG